MGAETKILVRVLKTYEELIEVNAVTRHEAEEEARHMEGVIAVLESGYPGDINYLYSKGKRREQHEFDPV